MTYRLPITQLQQLSFFRQSCFILPLHTPFVQIILKYMSIIITFSAYILVCISKRSHLKSNYITCNHNNF